VAGAVHRTQFLSVDPQVDPPPRLFEAGVGQPQARCVTLRHETASGTAPRTALGLIDQARRSRVTTRIQLAGCPYNVRTIGPWPLPSPAAGPDG
jgi:hypothetical protein